MIYGLVFLNHYQKFKKKKRYEKSYKMLETSIVFSSSVFSKLSFAWLLTPRIIPNKFRMIYNKEENTFEKLHDKL